MTEAQRKAVQCRPGSDWTAAPSSASSGGGIHNRYGTVSISSAIVANNTATISGNDIQNNETLNASYSLVEDSTGNGLIDGVNNNIIGQDP